MTNDSEIDSEAVLARGRRAAKILFFVNTGTVLVVAGFAIIGLKPIAFLLAAFIFGIQLLFLVVWFVPALLYHYAIQRRSLKESAALALWSFVQVLSNPSF